MAPPLGTERASFGAAKGAGDAAETADSNVARRRQEKRMVPMHPANFNGATEQLDRMRCAHAVNGAVLGGYITISRATEMSFNKAEDKKIQAACTASPVASSVQSNKHPRATRGD